MSVITFLHSKTYCVSGGMNIDKVFWPEEVMVASHRKCSFKERIARRNEKKTAQTNARASQGPTAKKEKRKKKIKQYGMYLENSK